MGNLIWDRAGSLWLHDQVFYLALSGPWHAFQNKPGNYVSIYCVRIYKVGILVLKIGMGTWLPAWLVSMLDYSLTATKTKGGKYKLVKPGI